jgi:hypothetical protein
MGKTVNGGEDNVRINLHKALREKKEEAWKELNKALEHLKNHYAETPIKTQQRA